jgi:hypothetical protein
MMSGRSDVSVSPTEGMAGMTLREGDRVVATRDLGYVRKGTQGVIVEKSGIWSSTYEVHFDGGATHRCDEREIAKVHRSSW